MRPLCRELERHIESRVEPLPEPLRTHLAECARCQRAWQRHQAYQRALHQAQQSPIPACELPWGRIQAQLAARAVQYRPPWTRPAFGWGTAVGVALLMGAAWYSIGGQVASSSREIVAHQPTLEQGDVSVSVMSGEVATPTPPPTRTVASARPRLTESARLQPPAKESQQVSALPAQPRPSSREFIDLMGSAPEMGAHKATSPETTDQSFAIASLPLTSFGVDEAAASVEYLPIRYGASSAYHEGADYEAVVGSF